MGATLEWDCIPFTFTTPQGSVALNTPDVLGAGEGGYYLIRRSSAAMGAPLRTTLDDVPADDGAIPHRVLRGGYRVTLPLELWKSPGTDGNKGEPATGATLVAMNDLLMRHLNRIVDDGSGRLGWNPSGSAAERMVDDLWWYGDAAAEDDDLLWTVTFELVSPFPYAMDAAEITTSISDGGSAVLANAGSSRFKPVIKAHGPTAEFTITNETSGKVLHYDASQPGASSVAAAHYIEFDFFRNTAYLDGSGASRKAGIDPLLSEFFPLEIGNNTISVDGCDIDVLWQSAWA